MRQAKFIQVFDEKCYFFYRNKKLKHVAILQCIKKHKSVVKLVDKIGNRRSIYC